MSSQAFLDQIIIQIKHYREEAGLSQAEMAEKLKIGNRSYQRYETGDSIPSIGFLFEVAKILNFNVRDIISPLDDLNKFGEYIFYTRDQRDEFLAASKNDLNELFKLMESGPFKLALSRNDLTLLREEPLFNRSLDLLALSTPRSTLLNPSAHLRLGYSGDNIPTTSFHRGSKSMGMLWGALLQTMPDYFIMKKVIESPAGTFSMEANCFFIKEGPNKYFIFRRVQLEEIYSPKSEEASER